MAAVLRPGKSLIRRAVSAAAAPVATVPGSLIAPNRPLLPEAPRVIRAHCFSARAGRGAVMASAVATADSAYDFTVTDIDGKKLDLAQYKGKVVLVVNVASQCGFTPQYKQLGELYKKYSSQGLIILGFPCNQFGGQEPAENSKIKQFALDRGAEFPMMSKVEVNGSNAEPFYKFLKSKQGGLLVSDIKWNFTKFLVNKDGEVVKRYGSATTPLSIENDIKGLL